MEMVIILVLGAAGNTTLIAVMLFLLLMASSIRYILEEANVLDSILHGAVSLAQALPTWSAILFIYLIVLVMNFFDPLKRLC